jgi:hypothetical protein
MTQPQRAQFESRLGRHLTSLPHSIFMVLVLAALLGAMFLLHASPPGGHVAHKNFVPEPAGSDHGAAPVKEVSGSQLPPSLRDGFLLLSGLSAALLAARRGRRTGVLLLAVILGFFSFELAFHSVHHVGDPQGAASCHVLSASQHVGGAFADPPSLSAPAPPATMAASVYDDRILPVRFVRPDEGRAPPAIPSAS